MKTIELTKGQVALVDDADYTTLNQYAWCAQKRRYGYHAARYDGDRYVYMHREILGLIDSKIQGEHRDGDGLNNQRTNLRIATKRQNGQAFQTLRRNKTSNFRGVCWHRVANKWMANIVVNGKSVYLGLFSEEASAARAYNRAAENYFGGFASPNLPDQETLPKVEKSNAHPPGSAK